MNFKNENGKYSNDCHKQGGNCCTSECKYINGLLVVIVV